MEGGYVDKLVLIKDSDQIVIDLKDEISYAKNEADLLPFDRWLLSTWDKLYEKPNVFRYKLNVEHKKVLRGKYTFYLELNVDRSTKRRTPEIIHSINQAFDANKFNFNKISDPNQEMFTLQEFKCSYLDEPIHKIIINDSPLCRGHSLFCPNIKECLPQIITLSSLKLVCSIMFVSNNRNLRVGFNSLGGMASVNHLHYHILELDYRLPIETLKCAKLKGSLYESIDYPAKCFCFEIITKSEIFEKCSKIYKLVCFLMDNNIAHNLYMSKGKSLSGDESNDVVRVFIWARTFYNLPKVPSTVNLAICEFSGQLPVKSAENFDDITYEGIEKMLKEVTEQVFDSIKDRVVELF